MDAPRTTRIQFKNILYTTDFSPASEAALPYAVTIARHYDAKIYVAHVTSPELYQYLPPEMQPRIIEAVENYARQQIRNLIASEKFDDVPREPLLGTGEIWDLLSLYVEHHNIDLIVVGTRGRRGARKFILGSVAEEIFRLAPCPVLTVGPHSVEVSADREPKRVLYATDFSADSLRALDYATSLAQEFQGCLIAVHVAPEPQVDPAVKIRLTDFFAEQLRDLVPHEAGLWCEQEPRVEFGSPADGILKTARERKADLIVMGVRGTGAMSRISSHFGGTAHRVVSEAHCPVLTVRGSGGEKGSRSTARP